MLLKADFQRAISDTIDQYPDLAVRYRAHDPIVLQHLEAIAMMLSMLSQNIEVAQTEVFEKARDATVFADAAMRGIVPKSRPTSIDITATNKSASAVRIEAGRSLQDSRGRPWLITIGAELAAGESAIIQAEQRTRILKSYTVTRDEPFHAVPISTKLDDGQFLSAIAVSDDLGEWAFADRYVNIAADDRVYHVEADDRQQVYIRFGMKNIVGVQPEVGTVFALRFDYSHGNVVPPLNSSFSLTSIQTPLDSFLTLNMLSVRVPGEDPISIDALRTLARYPSIYDANAVYLGEFDFLVRRNFPTLRFLSVWNERIEEHTREPSVDNINCLFIACVGIDDDLAVIPVMSETTTQGQLINESDWSGLQRTIAATVKRADDSYRVKFYTPILSPQSWRIDAIIGTAYQPSVIAERIRETILMRYGYNAIKRGGFTVAVQDVYSTLRRYIPEIAEPGADIQVFLPATPMFIVPESWRYVSDESLSIEVKAVTVTSPAWGW